MPKAGLNWSFNTSHLREVTDGHCPRCESKNVKQDGLFSPDVPGIAPIMIMACQHCGFNWVPDQKKFDREPCKSYQRVFTEEQKARRAETSRIYEAKRKAEKNSIKILR